MLGVVGGVECTQVPGEVRSSSAAVPDATREGSEWVECWSWLTLLDPFIMLVANSLACEGVFYHLWCPLPNLVHPGAFWFCVGRRNENGVSCVNGDIRVGTESDGLKF